MSEKLSITCDWCEKERIIDSEYPATYTLELRAIDTGVNTSGSCLQMRGRYEGLRQKTNAVA